MHWALFDDGDDFWPLTLTRPVWDLRVGILTMREKWRRILPEIFAVADGRLKERFDSPPPPGDCVYISGRCFPDPEFIRKLKNDLAPGEGWT
ncbi:MAG: putative sugar nucleotidyl transferase, partial [Bacteroidia bacterium]|nr:putative sugar nucleotidyl transferase [Bacteroidia bacterium]